MHKKRSVKIIASPEEQGLLLDNTKEVSTSTTLLEKVCDINTSTRNQLVNIERENRLSAILRLHSRGLNQEQIAQALNIDQSTVSRDLHLVQQESKNHVEKYMREDILLEYLRYLVGSNEITRTLWEMVQCNDSSRKEKLNAISLLMQMYDSRLQRLTAGPESFLNVKKSLSEIDLRKMAEANPILQARLNNKTLFGKDFSLYKGLKK
ncbi:MAG: helix-turn-helix domain-containing protein [Nitrososphaeraceae archaeon]